MTTLTSDKCHELYKRLQKNIDREQKNMLHVPVLLAQSRVAVQMFSGLPVPLTEAGSTRIIMRVAASWLRILPQERLKPIAIAIQLRGQ